MDFEDNADLHVLDALVEARCKAASEKRQSWVLQVAKEAGENRIIFEEKLPLFDDRPRPSDLRTHKFDDVASLAAYAEKFCKSDVGVFFVNDAGANLVVDDIADRGEREILGCAWIYDDEFTWWEKMIGQAASYETLRDELPLHAHTLTTPQMLHALRSIKYTEQTKYDVEIQELEGRASYGIAFEVQGAGSTIREIPRKFAIRIPVFADDLLEDRYATVEVTVNVQMPKKPGEALRILLVCPELEVERRKRIAEEIESLRDRLPNWLVVAGKNQFAKRIFK